MHLQTNKCIYFTFLMSYIYSMFDVSVDRQYAAAMGA